MAQLPLEKYRIIDFGTAYAGSIPGMLLADMGAQVIKVESHTHVDPLRHAPGPNVPGADDRGASAIKRGVIPESNPWFHELNRGKLGISVDFTRPQGAALIKELVKISDMVIENFTPDVLPRQGLDYQTLKAVKPDIIMLSLSVMGQRGPLRDTRAYANTIVALGGINTLVGYLGDTAPGSVAGAYGDYNAALSGALAALASLVCRNRTGRGQHIDLSEVEATAALLGPAIMEYTMNRRVPGPQGNRHPAMAPHGHYPCQGEDKWVSIAVGNEEEWQALLRAMGNPPWAGDEKFADAYGRLEHQGELDALIGRWTAGLTPYQVMERLQAEGVAAMPLLNAEGRYKDPHLQERQLLEDVPHPRSGVDKLFTSPWKLSLTPGRIRATAPLLGQHNPYVFGELLGLSQEEMQRLGAEGII